MKVLPYGDRAVLVELPAAQVIGLHAALVALEEFEAVVPAAATVLVEFDPRRHDPAAVEAIVRTCVPATDTGSDAELVEIAVRYDGPDLAEVAEETGLSRDEVIERHLGGDYTVQFCGFSPGFGYLTGLDARLRVPRRSSPRTAVPAGSVALADTYTGIYPRTSPGGWRLIGQTDAVLFDLDRAEPALLRPGVRVRFTRV